MIATAIAEPPVKTRSSRRTVVSRPKPKMVSGARSVTRAPRVRQSSDLIPQLINDHQAEVWRYLRAIGCPADIAEDLTQETFLLAYSRPFDYRGPAAAASYLRRAAYHRYISYVQRQRNSYVELRELEVNEATWSRWYENKRDHGEVLDVLDECLAELPAKSRYALELRFQEGLSRQEIAKELSMTEHGAKNLLQRAKQRLRASVETRLSATAH